VTVTLSAAPAPLLARARALLADGKTGGAAVADLLPAGLVAGRGWPGAGDLIGLAISDPAYLIVVHGQVVGGCGLKGRPAGAGASTEIGYGLAPAWQHRGLGTEAVRLLLEELSRRGAASVTAQVHPTNAASLRLLHRLGFTEFAGPADEHLWLRRSLSVNLP
jgi:phosphinothricin acetyltransferase